MLLSLVMQVDFVACYRFVYVRSGSICTTVPRFLSYEFGIWIIVARVFAYVKVSALVVRKLRGAFMICVGSLVRRSLLIRDREPVFELKYF